MFYLVLKKLFYHDQLIRVLEVSTLTELRDLLSILDIHRLAIPTLAGELDALFWRVVQIMLKMVFRNLRTPKVHKYKNFNMRFFYHYNTSLL